MSLTTRLCTKREEWDTFLAANPPQTFLQSFEWKAFNESQNHPCIPLLIEEGSSIQAIALVIEIRARRSSYLLCTHGPILRSDASVTDVFHAFTESVTRLAKERGCDFIRLCSLLADREEHLYLLKNEGYRPAPIHQSPELAWILDLRKSEEELLQEMRKATRYTIKRSEKDGITVSISDRVEDLDRFWEVYTETVDRQHFSPFSKDYFRQEFLQFKEKDRVRLFFGEHEGKTISTAFVVFSETSGFYHHGASSRASKVNGSCAVQWEAIKEAKRRGCSWYNFWGIAPPDQPKHPWAGLSLFKTGFGGQSEAYVHAHDKPITKKYWLNFLIETVRARKRGFRY
ncbi:peptidoglycan bridge formation glycyltransferase FemA/FemB family protein [Patescibacteria group bacterium]|nr:peptidoglycan bridge formation glycyltransferase FemA/FemB family protein [Patescibacteria group bacterium]